MIVLVGAICLCVGACVGYIVCAVFSVNKIIEAKEDALLMIEPPKTEPDTNEGVWVISPDGYYPYCNQCGYEPPYVFGSDVRTPYCSNCGAKMRKEVE